MKKIFKRLLVVSSCFIVAASTAPLTNSFTITAEAHSGRTDSSGGHHDYQNKSGLGSYHYHHGYSAHLHPNGVCPYESQTNANTSSALETKASSADSITADIMNSYRAVFDADYYYQTYPDLQSSVGNDSLKLFQHFYTSGMAEGRKGCADFDVKSYKEHNSDLEAAYGEDWKSYYEHYISTGCNENRIHQ